MILIGQYDSPFVRRVGVALRLYAFPFEHKPWSVFRNADEIAEYNPLVRVPTLVLDDGEVLIETFAILDALDEMAGHEMSMSPRSGPLRRRAFKVAALASGVADKAVSLVYETAVHNRATPAWVERCLFQIRGALNLLETDRAEHTTKWWMGEEISHADIAVATTMRFVSEAIGSHVQAAGWPALTGHSEQCEAMSVFSDVSQPFTLTPPR
ncbi:MAG: glutathione S-transferase family protein [Hyphomonadaceae bacterium]